MTATTHPQGHSVVDAPLYVAFEVGKKSWTLAMTSGFGVAPWLQTMSPGDWATRQRVLAKARARYGLAASARMLSCYEAGRDGFWIHRALGSQGLDNRVVDSSSIEVNRRARRRKTDRIDARKLVALLVRVCLGERDVWREVRVPTLAVEAARHVSRERTTLVQEQTALINQMRGWLTTLGATLPQVRRGSWWARVKDWQGALVPAEVQARLARAAGRLAMVIAQLDVIERAQAAALAAAPPDAAGRRLLRVKGVGVTSTATLLDEGLVWRDFQNRRQLGGIVGFVPVPYASGEMQRDQGISHAGNRRLQSVCVQLAWGWLRHQPSSALARWFHARYGPGKRLRRIGIVALARKLLIALWRYATAGVLPEGVVLKAA
jgi:transposase